MSLQNVVRYRSLSKSLQSTIFPLSPKRLTFSFEAHHAHSFRGKQALFKRVSSVKNKFYCNNKDTYLLSKTNKQATNPIYFTIQ